MIKNRKIRFVIHGRQWFSRNAGCYSKGYIEDIKTGKQYETIINGGSEFYRQESLRLLAKEKLIPYTKENCYLYERENNYPIVWNVTEVKRERDL
jgi:hypothetical protein